MTEQEKIENEYKRLFKKFLLGRIILTEEKYKKYEKARYSCFIFKSSKEHFICSLIYYLTCLSKAVVFLENKENPIKGIDYYCDLRDSFNELMSSASHPFLSEKEEKEISGILTDLLPEHLSVSYRLRKENRKFVVSL